MADFRPFKGWRYDPRRVAIEDVLAPPYDIIDSVEQERLYGASPYNCVRLILNRIKDSDNEKSNRYTRARDCFEKWCVEGVLTEEENPAFYIYRQTFADKVSGAQRIRTAILGRIRLEPFEKGIVVPHEKTLSKPRADRSRLLAVTDTNFSPVFGLYEDPQGTLAKELAAATAAAPLFEAPDKEGVLHAVWTVSDADRTGRISEALKDKKVYIADGHHRYTSSLEHALARRKQKDAPPDAELGSDFTLMALVAFEDKGLVLGPTHRMVRAFDGFDPGRVRAALDGIFDLEEAAPSELMARVDAADPRRSPIGLLLGRERALVLTLARPEEARKLLPPGHSDFWYRLDVNLVSHLILGKLWGLPPEEWESRIFYSHFAAEALEAARSGEAVCAFLLPGPRVSYLSELGRTGELMPQKSTYFFPKLASGLVFYHHEPTNAGAPKAGSK